MTISISIGKANTDLTVDFAALAPHVQDYVVRYGLTQILNDAHSSVTATEVPDAAERGEQALELANKKLDAMIRGEVRAFGGRSGDPIKTEANRLATLVINGALKAKGVKVKSLPKGKFAELVANYLTKNPSVMEQAKANIEATKGLDMADIEL